jgi:hypothetical protein
MRLEKIVASRNNVDAGPAPLILQFPSGLLMPETAPGNDHVRPTAVTGCQDTDLRPQLR